MNMQQNFRRFAAVLLSFVLLCGAFPLTANASDLSGDDAQRVLSNIQITIYGVPTDAQLSGLRQDALDRMPDGCEFFGWFISGDYGSLSAADRDLEERLRAVYSSVPEGENLKLTMQYLYFRPQPVSTPEDTFPTEAVEDSAPQEESTGYSAVPLYFQNDYPYTMYGSGTVASSGCSVTCLAMVATYLTGHEYLPDTLAHYFGGRATNNIARLEYGSEQMQLPFHKAENWHETYQALCDGKLAIALMEMDSLFTNSQHFIVLTGMNDEGKIMVNDPNKDNYSFWQLKNAFANGFSESDILLGYSGAWIYDKDAMPEEPFLYYEEEPQRSEPRYPDIQLTQDEIELLAKVVWVEAQGEPLEGQQAVAEVALNRLASDKFPNNLHDVIYGEGQFRSVPRLDEAEPFQAQYEAIENAIYGPYVLPKDVVYFATTPTNDNIWGQIGGHCFCYAAD